MTTTLPDRDHKRGSQTGQCGHDFRKTWSQMTTTRPDRDHKRGLQAGQCGHDFGKTWSQMTTNPPDRDHREKRRSEEGPGQKDAGANGVAEQPAEANLEARYFGRPAGKQTAMSADICLEKTQRSLSASCPSRTAARYPFVPTPIPPPGLSGSPLRKNDILRK